MGFFVADQFLDPGGVRVSFFARKTVTNLSPQCNQKLGHRVARVNSIFCCLFLTSFRLENEFETLRLLTVVGDNPGRWPLFHSFCMPSTVLRALLWVIGCCQLHLGQGHREVSGLDEVTQPRELAPKLHAASASFTCGSFYFAALFHFIYFSPPGISSVNAFGVRTVTSH